MACETLFNLTKTNGLAMLAFETLLDLVQELGGKARVLVTREQRTNTTSVRRFGEQDSLQSVALFFVELKVQNGLFFPA